MASSNGSNFRDKIKYVLIFLGVVFIVLTSLFIREVIYLRRSQNLSLRKIEFSNFLKSHGPLTVNNVGVVAPWMTFDYINKLFKLPPDYLSTSLTISDPRYPQLSISGYAHSNGINTTTFVGEIQSALRNYLTNKK